MKYLSTSVILFITLCFFNTAWGQSAERTITRSARFADINDRDNRFIIKNLYGSVTVEAYNGETVELSIEEEIQGSSSEIEQGKNELEYILERDGNKIFAYLTAPFINVNRYGDRFSYNVNMNDRTYRFTHTITARVPRNVLLEASTINKGILSVTGKITDIKAGNVNGDITLTNIVSATEVSTVNGNIEIIYDEVPVSDSKYNTVNGVIDIYFPDNLSANVYFSSLHGDLYTDFDNVTRLKPEVNKETKSREQTVTYRLDKFTPVRIGNGGTKLRFEVLNGDVYLRKQ